MTLYLGGLLSFPRVGGDGFCSACFSFSFLPQNLFEIKKMINKSTGVQTQTSTLWKQRPTTYQNANT